MSLTRDNIALGTQVTIIIFLIGSLIGIIKWYKKTDENYKLLKARTSIVENKVENLEKCEHDFNADMAVMKNEIKHIRESLP